ncbi:MAG: hypothetical protein HY645_03490 [Acidobacteria bacterium]|nr:hypothetical protein [Acidobacteriota bacterium]
MRIWVTYKGEPESEISDAGTIDDYIEEENPVRFLDAFVEQLDLRELSFEHANPAETGQPPYDPGDLGFSSCGFRLGAASR